MIAADSAAADLVMEEEGNHSFVEKVERFVGIDFKFRK